MYIDGEEKVTLDWARGLFNKYRSDEEGTRKIYLEEAAREVER